MILFAYFLFSDKIELATFCVAVSAYLSFYPILLVLPLAVLFPSKVTVEVIFLRNIARPCETYFTDADLACCSFAGFFSDVQLLEFLERDLWIHSHGARSHTKYWTILVLFH